MDHNFRHATVKRASVDLLDSGFKNIVNMGGRLPCVGGCWICRKQARRRA
ncbi:hypothetical protein glysoja_020496 [Glycine soja]|nr:hypothetical protein glysoja_020496 [Glycine soja]